MPSYATRNEHIAISLILQYGQSALCSNPDFNVTIFAVRCENIFFAIFFFAGEGVLVVVRT